MVLQSQTEVLGSGLRKILKILTLHLITSQQIPITNNKPELGLKMEIMQLYSGWVLT